LSSLSYLLQIDLLVYYLLFPVLWYLFIDGCPLFLFVAPNLSLKGEGQVGLSGPANPSSAVFLVVLVLLLVA